MKGSFLNSFVLVLIALLSATGAQSQQTCVRLLTESLTVSTSSSENPLAVLDTVVAQLLRLEVFPYQGGPSFYRLGTYARYSVARVTEGAHVTIELSFSSSPSGLPVYDRKMIEFDLDDLVPGNELQLWHAVSQRPDVAPEKLSYLDLHFATPATVTRWKRDEMETALRTGVRLMANLHPVTKIASRFTPESEPIGNTTHSKASSARLYFPSVAARDGFVQSIRRAVSGLKTARNTTSYKLTIEDRVTPENMAILRAQFAGKVQAPSEIPTPVAVMLRDKGNVVGGIHGKVIGDTLNIDSLWIHESYGGGGRGRTLVALIEQQARKMGALKVSLVTTSWQAPGFYEKLGYHQVHVFHDCPIDGQSHHIFIKNLLPNSPTVSLPGEMTIETDPQPIELATIDAGLLEHMKGKNMEINTGLSHFVLQNSIGEIAGGARGILYGNYFKIDVLHVENELLDLEGQMLSVVEAEALKKGARVVEVKVIGDKSVSRYAGYGYQTEYMRTGSPPVFYMTKKLIVDAKD